VLASNFELIVRFTGAGYAVELHIYADDALLKQMNVFTK
jgi:hypothetical protein